jgi:hypothetical protein
MTHSEPPCYACTGDLPRLLARQQRLREEVVEVLPYHPHRVRVAGSL